MSNKDQPNPFKVGDEVVYQPSQKGYYLDVNYPTEARLVRGAKYRIVEISNVNYITVEGYHHPGGGLYWTEFDAAEH